MHSFIKNYKIKKKKSNTFPYLALNKNLTVEMFNNLSGVFL